MTKEDINSQGSSFREYLRCFVLGDNAMQMLDDLARETKVYVFSGVIRNFLIGDAIKNRDIDFVVENVTRKSLLLMRRFASSVNQFGGVKIKFNGVSVDVWVLRNTWGLRQLKLKPNVGNLLKTVFFNSSAIVYDIRDSKFIYSEDFVYFLDHNKLDVVYPDNPNKALCLFNIFYYTHRYDFSVSRNLKLWVKNNYLSIYDFDAVQLKHNNSVVFCRDEIDSFLKKMIDDV